MKEFMTGVGVGFIIAALLSKLPGSYYNLVTDAMHECEKSLPRDQHCTIVAIPPTSE